MKVLLSAYACEPGKGSEPGVGWHWALEIARLGHEVWALTRANNRQSIEAELATLPPLPNLHFLYYDLPAWARWWKKGGRGVYLYYLLWQYGAYRMAKKVHELERFDRVHHVTFVSVRQPSFMGNLGIPFIFGPVGGGERAPWRLRFGYSFRGWVLDGLRDLMNLLVRIDPLMRRTFRQAEQIYVTSEQSLALLPRRFRDKATIRLAIGIEQQPNAFERSACISDPGALRVFFIGRFLYWKGMHLGLRAFALLLQTYPDAQLTMVGTGPEEKKWRKLADRLGVGERITWVPWVKRDELQSLYGSHDVLLFPSLHDSGGMVVLEAMTHGLPVVCLDLGGPGKIVDETSGRVVSSTDATESDVAIRLEQAMAKILGDTNLYSLLSTKAQMRADAFNWCKKISDLYLGRPEN